MIDVEVIKKARKIAKKHLVKYRFHSEDGSSCAVGCLRRAAGGFGHSYFLATEEKEFMDSLTPCHDLLQFNDVGWTTKKDVIKLFDCAIHILES